MPPYDAGVTVPPVQIVVVNNAIAVTYQIIPYAPNSAIVVLSGGQNIERELYTLLDGIVYDGRTAIAYETNGSQEQYTITHTP